MVEEKGGGGGEIDGHEEGLFWFTIILLSLKWPSCLSICPSSNGKYLSV